MNRTLILIALVATASALVFAAAQPAHAQDDVIAGLELDCLPEPEAWEFEESLNIPALGGFSANDGLQLLGWLFFAMMAFIAVLALVMLVAGGVRYIASAGSTQGMAAAKNRISNALLGLILAMFSTLILYIINPELTRLQLPELPIDENQVVDRCSGGVPAL